MNSPNPLSSGEPSALGFLPERFEPLHRRIQRFVDDDQHAGVSLLLARNGKIADTFATGFRNRELGLPMSRDTIVRVYSMTKIVVSVAALTLLEEGKLGLLDLVTDYLPEFRDLQVLVGGTKENLELVPADKPLTIQHLFTHTSGMIYDAPGELIGEIYRPITEGHWTSLEALITDLARLPLKWHPGTRFEYGLSTDVLGRVIEVVSGLRLDAYLQARILEPLGMFDTSYAVSDSQRARLAKVYEHDTDGSLRPVTSLQGETVEGRRDYPGELMIANHLTGLAVPFIDLGVGHGFGLGVAVRIDDGLSGTLGTLGAFGWSGMATTYCRIDPAEKLVALCFAQHLPFDEHGLFQRFANLSYQALA
jgi:CubicO group peptidase (beta-lactamase class C family)